tara:strand:+ start:237 stop:629 length:393 start_codon:yes stop_codon:yes gene_type:complete
MDKEEIQQIIDKAYPLIQRYFGKGKKSYPKIELHRDIYARLSGDEEQSGEHSGTSIAEYDERANEIYIYYPNIKNEEDLLRSLIHEYTHYLQDLTQLKIQVYAQNYDYSSNPIEIEAHSNENKWQMFSSK